MQRLRVYDIYREIYVEPSRQAVELALEYGYLPYMVQRYIDMLGPREAVELLEAFEKPVRQVVRANTLLVEPGELKTRLESLGFRLEEIPWAPGSFWVAEAPRSPSIGSTHEYLKGFYYVHRDATSLIPVLLLLGDGYKGDVLDACAAPGGKATFTAQILKERGGGTVYANDYVLYRLKSLIGHVLRMKLDNIVVTWGNAAELPGRVGRRFKRILLDAPCSGEGRISVDPGRKTRTSILDLAIMVKREVELLGSLIDMLDEEGVIAYSTCSIAPEENEYVVAKILESRRDVEVADPGPLPFNHSRWLTSYRSMEYPRELEKCIRIWPHRHGLFGFTTCLLKRVGA
ncbi:RsmB/NOP family class I SAM-dependent RNA methyltransferase [Desulfurococcus mucosus]|uniref:Ribosomal RNA methyltransferase NOP2 n=1 Tax=Desulfurococcus mucosus (strain ATCC 35584 / DSM 2162 / JCM 9187 / O7/1) TaxID=765177 RepID=E8R819_DESM0|nr:RsmB/NOP family class I SAM-dependent RNA methyltransferase [Desulfurococcus mucosus]ADV64645.1 ribosomal RNA methyltransferase NOP2 [Desulfurococcus mucosus DSM 2162]